MTLQELLDTLRLDILSDRSDRVDGAPDQLWTDATLIRYIDEAQTRFARLGLVLRDASTPEVCQVTLREMLDSYPLDPSVLAVISARLDGDGGDLVRAGHAAFGTVRAPDPYWWDQAGVTNLMPGKPLAWSTDEGLAPDERDRLSAVSLRLYPAPSAAYAGTLLRLRVLRLPLNPLTPARLSAQPEIPAVHHIEMLDWAAYLALRIVDVDQGMPARAAEFRASFDAAVQAARREAMRKLFAPQPWGFGRGGWAWEP